MSNVRKFNVRTLFESFTGRMAELQSLLHEFHVVVQGEFTPESACSAILDGDVGDEMNALLYELNDLSSTAGFEHVNDASESYQLAASIIEPGIPPAVAALRLRNADKDAFRNALDRLLVNALQSKSVAVHHGKEARTVTDKPTRLAVADADERVGRVWEILIRVDAQYIQN